METARPTVSIGAIEVAEEGTFATNLFFNLAESEDFGVTHSKPMAFFDMVVPTMLFAASWKASVRGGMARHIGFSMLRQLNEQHTESPSFNTSKRSKWNQVESQIQSLLDNPHTRVIGEEMNYLFGESDTDLAIADDGNFSPSLEKFVHYLIQCLRNPQYSTITTYPRERFRQIGKSVKAGNMSEFENEVTDAKEQETLALEEIDPIETGFGPTWKYIARFPDTEIVGLPIHPKPSETDNVTEYYENPPKKPLIIYIRQIPVENGRITVNRIGIAVDMRETAQEPLNSTNMRNKWIIDIAPTSDKTARTGTNYDLIRGDIRFIDVGLVMLTGQDLYLLNNPVDLTDDWNASFPIALENVTRLIWQAVDAEVWLPSKEKFINTERFQEIQGYFSSHISEKFSSLSPIAKKLIRINLMASAFANPQRFFEYASQTGLLSLLFLSLAEKTGKSFTTPYLEIATQLAALQTDGYFSERTGWEQLDHVLNLKQYFPTKDTQTNSNDFVHRIASFFSLE